MNCYTTHTAEKPVPMTKEEFLKLKELLENNRALDPDMQEMLALGGILESDIDPDTDYIEHDMTLRWIPQDPAYPEDPWGAYLRTADESSKDEGLPECFLKALGEAIKTAGMPWLEVGYAYTADKPRPNTHGGGAFRIYPDGRLVHALVVWPDDKEEAG